MAQEKQSIFKRIKHWWKEELTEDDRDVFKIAGIWCFDGALWGSLITAGIKNAKNKNKIANAIVAGYLQGQTDAYKDMAQNNMNPYRQMDMGMRRLEKQGIAKKF